MAFTSTTERKIAAQSEVFKAQGEKIAPTFLK